MNSLRDAATREALTRHTVPDSPISARGLAERAGLHPPISFVELFAMIAPEEITERASVITPTGTALGGSVEMTLRSNGSYSVDFHMHDSGTPDYDFEVRAIFTTPGGLVLVAQHSGHVEGTISTIPFVHEPNREDNGHEDGGNPMIRGNWADIKGGRLWVTKDYSATGVIGFVEDLAKSVLDIAAGAGGGALGVVIGLGAEVGQIFGDLGLGGAFGIVAGVVVFAFGGTLVLAVVAGVVVGAVTNALIEQRSLRQEEIDLAEKVFKGTLPYDDIRLTNLSGLGGRAFTMPGGDKKIYLNLGDGYDSPDPIQYKHGSYDKPGQLLIHELTHAWQIAHAAFLPGLVCEGIVNQANNTVGQSVYVYGPPGPDWSSGFNLEQQAAIVDQWFGGKPTPVVPNRKEMDENDPYFIYIRDHIRAGVS